jgi:hypothetical protein
LLIVEPLERRPLAAADTGFDLAGAARLQALNLGIGVAGLVSLVMTPARGASRLASLRKLRGAAVPLSLQVASSDIPQFVAMVRRRAQAKKDAVTSRYHIKESGAD